VKLIVAVTDAVSPTVTEAELALSVNVSSSPSVISALADTTESPLNASADTRTRATRLNNVCVDIYFLSLVVTWTIQITADRESISVS